MPNMLRSLTHSFRTLARATVFFLKVFPMIPSRPVDWVTPQPLIEKVRYPTQTGWAEGDLYRPPGDGPFPGVVVCLGVVPFEVEHPQVAVLGRAFARAGCAALLYWSPAMRGFQLDPVDVENIALAYRWLIDQPLIDPARSVLMGTCVGGSFALMAAASPLIRDTLACASAYAPFSSMWTFARDIASATRANEGSPEPWQVDPLTRKVFVYSLTGGLETGEAERLRRAYLEPGGKIEPGGLSEDGRAIADLLSAADPEAAHTALRQLPTAMQERLNALSPVNYLADIHAPLIVLLHDRGDVVIPVGESRRLVAALDGRSGVGYTEMQFTHLDPTRGKLPFFSLLRELIKFFRAVYPIFHKTVGQ